MLHVPGAAAQSTSPFGVCRVRRATNGPLNEPEPSVVAKPEWPVSQSLASPELLFLHSAQPTDTLGVKPVPEMVTFCRWSRLVDGVTVTTGFTSAAGVSTAVGADVSGAVVVGTSGSGVVVPGGSVPGAAVGSVVVGGAGAVVGSVAVG